MVAAPQPRGHRRRHGERRGEHKRLAHRRVPSRVVLVGIHSGTCSSVTSLHDGPSGTFVVALTVMPLQVDGFRFLIAAVHVAATGLAIVTLLSAVLLGSALADRCPERAACVANTPHHAFISQAPPLALLLRALEIGSATGSARRAFLAGVRR